jgi:hypothetical protein
MKLGIGFVVCGRIAFTREVVESILYFNPEIVKYPWVVADDNSEPCVRNYFEKIAKEHKIQISYLWHSKRRGINANLKQMFDWARVNVDLLLSYVNDFKALRKIDIKGVKKFFEENKDAGQVQMFHWKGKIGDKNRERSMTNWVTGKSIVIKETHQAGEELLDEANWVWIDGVCFTRVYSQDYFEGALGLPKEEKYIKMAEIIKAKNFMQTGLKIYEMQDQPYLHLDYDGTHKTPGSIA